MPPFNVVIDETESPVTLVSLATQNTLGFFSLVRLLFGKLRDHSFPVFHIQVLRGTFSVPDLSEESVPQWTQPPLVWSSPNPVFKSRGAHLSD